LGNSKIIRIFAKKKKEVCYEDVSYRIARLAVLLDVHLPSVPDQERKTENG
jgi:hypothetical protein